MQLMQTSNYKSASAFEVLLFEVSVCLAMTKAYQIGSDILHLIRKCPNESSSGVGGL